MNERVDEGPAAGRPPRRATIEGGAGTDGDGQAWFTGGHPAGEGYPPAPPRRQDLSPAEDRGDDDPGGGQQEVDTDLDLLEPSWTPPRRGNRLTVVLVAGILVAAGFGGGALVQKRHDQGVTASAAPSFARAFRNGTSGGGFGEGAGSSGSATGGPGGALAGGAGNGSAGAGGSGSQAARGTAGAQGAGAQGAGVPVAVGTVVSVSGSTLTLKNFAGAQVVVHVPAGTPVTVPGPGGLQAGMTVSVTGTKASDGAVTASSVVSRSAG